MISAKYKFVSFFSSHCLAKASSWLLYGILSLLTLPFAISGYASESTSNAQKEINLLWVSEKQDAKLDFIFRGFVYNTKDQFNITFIPSNTRSEAYSKINYGTYEYIIASGDSSWHFIESLEFSKNKVGVGVSQAVLDEFSKTTQTSEYIISKEQPPQRVFAFMAALDLNHSQSAALFYKNQSAQRLEFIQQAKEHEVPFKPIFINQQSNTIEAINSVFDCCRILHIKEHDFEAIPQKHRSLFFESYRRKIITVGNRSEMLNLGAMYVIYTPDHMLGKQAAILATDLINNKPLARLQMPQEFVIDSNHKLRATIGSGLAKQTDGDLITKTKLAEQLIDKDIVL